MLGRGREALDLVSHLGAQVAAQLGAQVLGEDRVGQADRRLLQRVAGEVVQPALPRAQVLVIRVAEPADPEARPDSAGAQEERPLGRSGAEQARGQIDSLERDVGRPDAEQPEQRGCQVDQGARSGNSRGRDVRAGRKPQDPRHLDLLREHGVAVLDRPMLAERLAVVGDDRHHRSLELGAHAEQLEHFRDRGVRVADVGVVQGAQVLEVRTTPGLGLVGPIRIDRLARPVRRAVVVLVDQTFPVSAGGR